MLGEGYARSEDLERTRSSAEFSEPRPSASPTAPTNVAAISWAHAAPETTFRPHRSRVKAKKFVREADLLRPLKAGEF